MELSVVIVSWNTRDLLGRCLGSLYQCSTNLVWEAIVVDNGSHDGTQEMVKQQYPRVRLIENQSNAGFASANNTGIKASRGRFVFMLNSDTEVRADTLPGLVGFLEEHPRAGAVGCRLVGSNGRYQAYAFGRDPTFSHLIARNLRRVSPLKRDRAQMTGLVDWVSGAALGARKEALEQVGLLDERIRMYFEDVDLCLRIRKAGWQVWLAQPLEVVHLGGGTPVTSTQRRGLYYQSLRYFYTKHYGAVQSGLLSLLLFVYQLRSRTGNG